MRLQTASNPAIRAFTNPKKALRKSQNALREFCAGVVSDFRFKILPSDAAPHRSRENTPLQKSQSIIATGPQRAKTDYKREGEKSEALEMCIRILLGHQKIL